MHLTQKTGVQIQTDISKANANFKTNKSYEETAYFEQRNMKIFQ